MIVVGFADIVAVVSGCAVFALSHVRLRMWVTAGIRAIMGYTP